MEIIMCLACALMLMICIYIYKETIKLSESIKKVQAVLKDDARRYYVICPDCGRKIILTDVQILVLEEELNI